ncbi:MAG: SET domain-containing protein-lysine N-methyltransferase [Victivallales bacterium]
MKISPKNTKEREVTPSTPAFSWVNPKLEVRKTEKLGKGMFAKVRIAQGERLCVWGGGIVPTAEEHGDLGIQIDEDLTLIQPPGDPANFINHSCSPNAGLKGQIVLVAMREIEADEEITFDYAMCLHPSPGAPRYEMKCCCGAKKCRGVVTEDDWQRRDLRKRYKGYFSWYIQEKIKKIKEHALRH